MQSYRAACSTVVLFAKKAFASCGLVSKEASAGGKRRRFTDAWHDTLEQAPRGEQV